MQGRSMLNDVEMAYSRQIFIYNEQVIQGGMKPSLVNLCVEMANSLDDQVLVCLYILLHAHIHTHTYTLTYMLTHEALTVI